LLVGEVERAEREAAYADISGIQLTAGDAGARCFLCTRSTATDCGWRGRRGSIPGSSRCWRKRIALRWGR
jgi:hypothetical protein